MLRLFVAHTGWPLFWLGACFKLALISVLLLLLLLLFRIGIKSGSGGNDDNDGDLDSLLLFTAVAAAASAADDPHGTPMSALIFLFTTLRSYTLC